MGLVTGFDRITNTRLDGCASRRAAEPVQAIAGEGLGRLITRITALKLPPQRQQPQTAEGPDPPDRRCQPVGHARHASTPARRPRRLPSRRPTLLPNCATACSAQTPRNQSANKHPVTSQATPCHMFFPLLLPNPTTRTSFERTRYGSVQADAFRQAASGLHFILCLTRPASTSGSTQTLGVTNHPHQRPTRRRYLIVAHADSSTARLLRGASISSSWGSLDDPHD